MSGCEVPGCDAEVISRGMCRRHYDQWRAHGTALPKRLSRACSNCGVFFETTRRDRVFCSQKCRDAFRYRRRLNPMLQKVENPLKPVNWFDTESVEPRSSVDSKLYTLSDVYDRQDGRCDVCGGLLDRDVEPLSPEAPAPSWVLPPEQGGAIRFENRILVHRRCLTR